MFTAIIYSTYIIYWYNLFDIASGPLNNSYSLNVGLIRRVVYNRSDANSLWKNIRECPALLNAALVYVKMKKKKKKNQTYQQRK